MSDNAKKKLLILGATGLTGRQLVEQAIDQGHDITALVRSPNKLQLDHPALRTVVGDATDPTAIDWAVEGRDSILCALGTRSLKELFSAELMTRSMHALIPAMKRRGVDRLILESALGVGASAQHAPRSARLVFATVFRGMGKDKARAEEYVRSSGLDWTVVYPPTLTNGPASSNYQVGEALQLKGVPKVSRTDVAHFMLSQLSDSTYSRKMAIVSS